MYLLLLTHIHLICRPVGKNWAKLSSAVGTKSLAQIKNYYYDHHKKNRNNGGEDSTRTSAPDSTDGESDAVERSEMYLAATGGAPHFPAGRHDDHS